MAEDRMRRYSDIIIDHSQFPRHHGTLTAPTHQGRGENPFCGDRVMLQLRVGAEGVIEEAAVESVGCAISMASASLLASHLEGLDLAQAGALFSRVHDAMLGGVDESAEAELGELAALSFASHYPSRVKCATLAWHVLKHALRGDESMVSTE